MNNAIYKRAKELFDYREDGNLIWKKKVAQRIKIGDIAGTKDKSGYRRVYINNKLYLAHRIIFLLHHGYMSENFIDHIDKNPSNNRIENLREISNQCNLRNSKNRSTNKSGIKGICWYKNYNKWRVYIMVNTKHKNLGYFKDFDEAVLMRFAAEQCLDWDGCDSCSPAYQYALKNKLITKQ